MAQKKLIKLLHLFEMLFIIGEPLPEIWKDAWITPFQKKGKKSSAKTTHVFQ